MRRADAVLQEEIRPAGLTRAVAGFAVSQRNSVGSGGALLSLPRVIRASPRRGYEAAGQPSLRPSREDKQPHITGTSVHGFARSPASLQADE